MSQFERQTAPSGSASTSAVDVSSGTNRSELRGSSYEEGAAKLKPEEVEADRVKKAQASWEKLFGEKIGGELFALVREHLSVADLTQHAQSGIEAMAKASGSLASPTEAGAAGGIMDTKAEADAVNKLVAALAADAAKSAQEWLQSDKGQALATSISQWIEEHPGWTTTIIATSAISAAVAAYLSNMDVPELEKTFKLGGGWSAGAMVDFGKIQSMSLEAAKATLSYQTKGLEGTVIVAHDGEKDVNSVTAKLSASGLTVGQTTAEAKGDVVVSDDGTLTLSASGGLERDFGDNRLEVEGGVSQRRTADATTSDRVHGRVRFGDESEYREFSGHYDRATDTFLMSQKRAVNGGKTSLTDSVERDADGVTTSGREFEHNFGAGHSLSALDQESSLGTGQRLSYEASELAPGLGMGLAVGTGTLSGVNANLNYKRADLTAALDLEMKDELSRLSLSAASKPTEGWSYGADLKWNFTDSRLEELGANLGWRHPTEFKSFALGYKASWLEQNPDMQHHFDASFEYAVGRVSARVTGSMDLHGRTLHGTQADVLMGYKLNSNWTALGGVGYQGQRNADTHHLDGDLTYRAGAQYKNNVGFTVGYTPEQDAWMVGITIPLGR